LKFSAGNPTAGAGAAPLNLKASARGTREPDEQTEFNDTLESGAPISPTSLIVWRIWLYSGFREGAGRESSSHIAKID
jgi:hypothetical protein